MKAAKLEQPPDTWRRSSVVSCGFSKAIEPEVVGLYPMEKPGSPGILSKEQT